MTPSYGLVKAIQQVCQTPLMVMSRILEIAQMLIRSVGDFPRL